MIQTTFYQDFSIADRFGIDAVHDTYRRAFRAWKNDYQYLTALVINLNWKIWEHYDAGRELYAKVYDKLWREADQYALSHLKDDELQYYYSETD